MKNRSKSIKVKTIKTRRQPSASVRLNKRAPSKPQELPLMKKITQMTDELQILRSRLANGGENLPFVGTHRIAALEMELERLWEQRRQEQAAPLREAALTDQDIEVLAFPGASRSRNG